MSRGPLTLSFAVFVIALIPRAVIAALAPAVSGDWETYRIVAENILRNGCVSLSEPAGGACIAHWGGNQLPGFPAFVAGVWSLFPQTWFPVALLHSLLFAGATTYLFLSLRAAFAQRVAFAAALLVALSPLTIPWARYTLTETLALSATIWLFAELIWSLKERQLRLITVALPFAAACFLRYDSVLLAVPVAFVGFYLHRPWSAVRRGTVILLIAAIPLGAWWVRSAAVGLGPLPNINFSPVLGALPKGYLAWGETWVRSQYQAKTWIYPVHKAAYSNIQIDASIYSSELERQQVETLLGELTAYDGQPFPRHIDAVFLELANDRRSREWFDYYLLRPFSHASILWFNPLNSAGWPVSLNLTDAGGGLWSLAINNPVSAAVKAGTAAYRVLLLILALGLAVWAVRVRVAFAQPVIVAAALYAIARTTFLASFNFMENRYVLEAVPLLEVAVVCGIWSIIGRRKHRGNAESS